jgi:ABC-type lipoprotein release transport system permease subunit
MASANLLRFRLRTTVVLLCLLSAAAPLLTALAMQEGLKNQALAMLKTGPDLLVAGDDFGRPCAVPLSWAETVHEIPGVVLVLPRAVGRVIIEDLPALLVGIGPALGSEGLPEQDRSDSWHTSLPSLQQGELAIGSAIARHFDLRVGDRLQLALPTEGAERFRYRSFEVAILIDPALNPVWSAGLILAHFDDLQRIFLRSDMATELMVYCREGYEERIAQQLSERLGPRAKIQDRSMMEGYFHGGFDRRAGAFLVYFLAALALSVPVLALAAGHGLTARRREVAVMKCMGWETREILLLQMMESVLTAVAGASLAVILSLVWLKFGAGWPLNQFLMPGAEELPPFQLPYLMCWTPVLLIYIFSISVSAGGAVASAWRAASVEPGKVLLGGGG